MLKINQLAKQFSLSRSTLLYYDKIGLLKPSGRSESNYRLYNSSDVKRMEQIALFREAGLSLESIAEILDSDETASTQNLEQKLIEINQEISILRRQQKKILELLNQSSLVRRAKSFNKDQWVKMLKASGMSDDDMHKWHMEFERDLPEAHTDFLESLGIDQAEIEKIKAWSKSTK